MLTTPRGYFTYTAWPISFIVPNMVKHLPPVVKQLLSSRSAQSLPSPPIPKLHAVLTSTFNDAQQRKVENGWLVLSVSICSTNA